MAFTVSCNGKLAGHIERAYHIEHPDEKLSFEHWALAMLANAAAKVLQAATVAEMRDALISETKVEDESSKVG